MTNCQTSRTMGRFAPPPLRSRTFPFTLARVSWFPEPRKVKLKCLKGGETQRDFFSDAVEHQVDALLKKPENQVLLNRLERASQRVEVARQQLEELQKEELEAKQLQGYLSSLQLKASKIAESQGEISEARRMIEEAERSLRVISEQKVSKEEDRLESVKAALISAIGGTIAGLPIYLTEVTNVFDLLLPSAVGFISCALFGVTFRYVVRRNVDDFHLKSGAVAAFSIAKGLGMLAGGIPLEPTTESLGSHLFDGSLYIAESFLVFASAALALDFCLKARFLSPFPESNVSSSTKLN